MTQAHPTQLEGVLACSGRPLRVLLVHQSECAFMCVWHLTSFFDTFGDDLKIDWHSCSPADLTESGSLKRTLDKACEADVIVFCLSGSPDLAPAVRTWVERWAPRKSGQGAALGLLLVCRSGGSSLWESYLRGVSKRSGMRFLGVGHCACAQPPGRCL